MNLNFLKNFFNKENEEVLNQGENLARGLTWFFIFTSGFGIFWLTIAKTEEVVVFDENEKITKKTIIQFTLSVDHRMIDGAVGANFLNEIASFLEEPINLLG